jgi:hypothetical protein
MKIDIDNLNEKELIDLNHRIVERLKFLESMRTHAEMMAFSVGEKVVFYPSGREKVVGVLVKYNKKTVTVLTEEGQRWNVSPHLLTKIEESKRGVKKSGNVIEMSTKV